MHLSGPASRKNSLVLPKAKAFFNVSILKWKYSYVFVQLFEVQDHSPPVIFLRSHKDWRYVFFV